MSQPQVKVFNPKGRNGFTSLKSAQRYVKRGLARWRKDGAVEFIDDTGDYRAVAVLSVEQLTRCGYDRDVSCGAMASLDAIKHLPVAGNVTKLLTRTTRSRRTAVYA
jgi:hypothetical protein